MIAIVFSKDRAMQLEAFLRSFRHHVTGDVQPVVLYDVSSNAHAMAYAEVLDAVDIGAVRQGKPFKDHVLDLLPRIGPAMFFVDDQLFVRPWHAAPPAPGLSLRLGLHLTRCYPTDAPQPLPRHRVAGDTVVWRWDDGEGDWGYPLSVDGHVFSAPELREMLAPLSFTSPNTLETALQVYRPRYAGTYGRCYTTARVVNVPWNRVQTDVPNRCRDASREAVDALLTCWERGYRIHTEVLYGTLNESCHQELDLPLVARAASVVEA